MSEKDFLTNQTQFASEEPLFEEEDQFKTVEELEALRIKSAKPSFFKTKQGKIILIFGIILFIALIGIVLLTVLSPKPQEVVVEEVVPEVVEIDLGPLEARVEELDELIDQADPTKQGLPFPLLDMRIILD